MKRKALTPLVLAAITLMSSSVAFGQVERIVVRVDGMV